MYENKTDPVVKYYDFSLALCSEVEVGYYANIAANADGPVLDLCCGTGILSIATAHMGKPTYALDNSQPMMAAFREKIAQESRAIRNLVTIKEAPMTSFDIPEKVGAVICRDSFFHNLTPEDERDTLLCINRCMTEDGTFAFNIHNPNPKFLTWALSSESSKFTDRQTYRVPGTQNELTIQQSLSIDLHQQLLKTQLRFITRNQSGNIIEKEFSSWKTRYMFPYEVFYLLELCGFSITNVFGSYNRISPGPDTMLIIEAAKLA